MSAPPMLPRLLDYGNPVRTNAPLNRVLLGWWLTLPQRMGGQHWPDLAKSRHAAFTGLSPSSATVGWAGTTRPGGMGELRFNGSTAYATVGSYPEYDFANTTFTVSCWVKATAAGYLVCRRVGNSIIPNGGWFLRLDSGGTLTARIVNDSNTAAANRTTVSTSVLNGAWWHVAVVLTTDTATLANNDVTLYLNGVQNQGSRTDNADTPYTVPTWPLTFGALSDQQAGSFLTGSLDDIRIVGRGLAVEEIRALYLASRRRYPQELRYRAWPIVGAASATQAVGAGTQSATAVRIVSAAKAATGSEASSSTRLASSLKAGTGADAGTSTRVASSLRAGSGTETSTSVRVASSVKARTVTEAGSSARLASSLRAGIGTETGSSTRVASSLKAGLGTEASTSARLTSSLRAALGAETGNSTRVASSLRTGSGTEAGSSTRVASSLRGQTGVVQGQTLRVASSLRAGAGTVQAGAVLLASSLLTRTGVVQAVAQALASSVVSGVGLLQGSSSQEGHAPTQQSVAVSGALMGQAVRLASSLLGRPGLTQAVAQTLASGLVAGTGVASSVVQQVQSASALAVGTMQGQGSTLASQIVTAAGVVQALASLLQHATTFPSGLSQAQALTLASSVLTFPAVMQALALAGNAILIERTGTVSAVAQAIAHATVEQLLQAQAIAVFLASSPHEVVGTTEARAQVRLITSSVIGCLAVVDAQVRIEGHIQYGDDTHILRPGNWRVAIRHRRRRAHWYTYAHKRR